MYTPLVILLIILIIGTVFLLVPYIMRTRRVESFVDEENNVENMQNTQNTGNPNSDSNSNSYSNSYPNSKLNLFFRTSYSKLIRGYYKLIFISILLKKMK